MTYIEQVEEWLAENEIAESTDPLVVSLRSAAKRLEALDSGLLEMTDAQTSSGHRSALYSFNEARRLLQLQLDRNDSLSKIKRHQVVYCEIAATSLGLLDVKLLRQDTFYLVQSEILADHGINLDEFDPVIMEG